MAADPDTRERALVDYLSEGSRMVYRERDLRDFFGIRKDQSMADAITFVTPDLAVAGESKTVEVGTGLGQLGSALHHLDTNFRAGAGLGSTPTGQLSVVPLLYLGAGGAPAAPMEPADYSNVSQALAAAGEEPITGRFIAKPVLDLGGDKLFRIYHRGAVHGRDVAASPRYQANPAVLPRLFTLPTYALFTIPSLPASRLVAAILRSYGSHVLSRK